MAPSFFARAIINGGMSIRGGARTRFPNASMMKPMASFNTCQQEHHDTHILPPINMHGAMPTQPTNLASGMLMNDYDEYRRALCGGGALSYKALLVDAAGTLIVPSEPAAKVYHDFGVKYGVEWSETEILMRYRWAYAQPWSRSRLRYENDARPFWQFIVEKSTGCNNPAYVEELYQYYSTAQAWRIADPDAGKSFKALRRAGVKVAVVSNFDTRLRPLMNDLHCCDWFDAMIVSAEVGLEKPNPAIFSAACELLGVQEQEVVHVGDDRRNDLWGARDAGCDAWLWGEDVTSFCQVAEKIGVKVTKRVAY